MLHFIYEHTVYALSWPVAYKLKNECPTRVRYEIIIYNHWSTFLEYLINKCICLKRSVTYEWVVGQGYDVTTIVVHVQGITGNLNDKYLNCIICIAFGFGLTTERTVFPLFKQYEIILWYKNRF